MLKNIWAGEATLKSLVNEKKTVSLINRAIDGLMNGRTNRWRDQQMDGPTDRQTNR